MALGLYDTPNSSRLSLIWGMVGIVCLNYGTHIVCGMTKPTMFACTIGADIDRTMPVWQPRALPKTEPAPAPEPEPAPEPTQGPGQRKAGAGSGEPPDPLAELAKEVLGK